MRVTSLLLAVLLFSYPLARAEEIELKDGSKISGKLTAVEGNVFRVKTAYGEIQVPRSEVVLIRFQENGSKSESGSREPKADASSVDESLDGTTYSNRTAHFQVNMPPGWSLAPELRQGKEIVAALKSDDQAHCFMVTSEKYTGSLKTYELLAETHVQSNFQDFEKISEAPTKLDDRDGTRVVFKAKKGAMVFKFLVYILPYDGLMVRLSFFTLEPLFNDAEPVFEKIAKSYHSTANKPVAKRAPAPFDANLNNRAN